MEKSYYYAFISYSRKDIKDAKWIHSSLEKFHIPTKLPRAPEAEPIPKPLRCFRDINDLDVMPESFVKGIENALSSSKYLVIVCSPNSARSAADGNHYVDWEIQKFIEVHGLEYAKNHILPVIISGEISHTTKETECLPPSLYKLGDDFLTHNFPILDYGDENVLTKDAKNDFILKILAFLLQVKYSVLNDRYQKAQRKRRHFILGAAISLVVIFALISVYAAFGWRSSNKNLAFSHYAQANTLLEQGETSYALAYYKKSLQLDENPVVRDKVYSLITNNSWLVEKDSITNLQSEEIDYFEKEMLDKFNLLGRYENFENLYTEKEHDKKNGQVLVISNDKKYIAFRKNDNTLQIIDTEREQIVFSDFPENGYDWSVGLHNYKFINENTMFAYEQRCDSKFIIKSINLVDNSVSVVRKDHKLSNWNISPNGEFLVYFVRIADSIYELSVYNVQEKKMEWSSRDVSEHGKITFSPDNIHFATTGVALKSYYLSRQHGIANEKKIFAYKLYSEHLGSAAQKFDKGSTFNSTQVCVHNVFHKDEKIPMSMNGSVAKMQFSNDGRKIAVATNRETLYVFATRDGSEIVKNRAFDDRISEMAFTFDDNSIQIRFQHKGTKEYELRVNKLNYDVKRTPLVAGVTIDTVILKGKYFCNLLANAKDGSFLEIRNLKEDNDYFIIPLNKDLNAVSSYSIKKTPNEEFILLYDRENSHKTIEVYSVDFTRKDYIRNEKEISLSGFVKDISIISEKYAVVLCELENVKNLYLVNFLTWEFINIPTVNNCITFGGNSLDELYVINKNENNNFELKKINLQTATLEWTVPFKKNIYTYTYTYTCWLPNILIDRNDNIYVVTDSKELAVFNKNGRLINKIHTTNLITNLSINNSGTYLAVGTNSSAIFYTHDEDADEIEVWRLKDYMLVFSTNYKSDNSVLIKKIAFSENSNYLHIAGVDSTGKGFYDIWDTDSSIKFDTTFYTKIPMVFGFDVFKDMYTCLYTLQGVYIKYLFDNSKKTMSELKENDVYQLIGGWTLDESNRPQLIKIETKNYGNLCKWLTADLKETRTVHPMSETCLTEIFELHNSIADREIILDTQADHAESLDYYSYDVSISVAEHNYKRQKTINSEADELALTNEWEREAYFAGMERIIDDKEADKLYTFYIFNYIKKVQNSVKPLYELLRYCKRLKDEETVQMARNLIVKYYKYYPEDMSIPFHQLYGEESFFDKKSIVLEMIKNSNKAYSFSELEDILSYFTDIACDLSFDETKEISFWLLKCFKTILMENFSLYASKFEKIFLNYFYMTMFYKEGLDYWLNCVDYFYEGLTDSQKILLKIAPSVKEIQIRNNIVKRNMAMSNKLDEEIDFSNLSDYVTMNANFIWNAYMYYSLVDNSKKNNLLAALIELEPTFSTNILTDVRIYKKLGNSSVCSEKDIKKALVCAWKLLIERLKNGQPVGIKIENIVSGGQAEKLRLKRGDTLLFYDNYPLSNTTRSFFTYDLHTSERDANKSLVEIVVLHDDGRLQTINVEEGFLGIQF